MASSPSLPGSRSPELHGLVEAMNQFPVTSPGDAAVSLPLRKTAEPADPSAVAGLLEWAFAEGSPVYPLGGGTQLGLGARATEPGLGLSLRGLNRVVDYPSRDLTITVEAGVTIDELRRHLAGQGQRLPIDVPNPSLATIGGAVAANVAGPRQYRWGTLRDYVIGVRAVDGAGRVFSAGGRVVKNAAGYDLCRLLAGSHGTLAVLVQVTLMVKPQPEESAFVIAEAVDGDAAERVLAGLVRTRTLPSAIELLGGPAWASLGEVRGSDSLLGIAVGLEGSADEVSWMVDQLQAEWRDAGISSPHALLGEDARAFWERLTEFPAGSAATSGDGELTIQFHVLPAKVCGLVQGLLACDSKTSIQAHAGNGMVLVRLGVNAEEAAATVEQRLRPLAASLGGHATVVAQPSDCDLSRQVLFGPSPPGWQVMQAIKRQFDPKGILNRGRFLLG